MQCLVTELQCYLFSHRNLQFYITGSWKYKFPMDESESTNKVLHYCFEPVSVSNYSDNEDSSSETETDVRE